MTALTAHVPIGSDSPQKAPRDFRYLNKLQREEIKGDIAGAEAMLKENTPHLRARYPRVLRKQIQNLERMLERSGPPRLAGSELDSAVRRRDKLQERISGALLSSEEMRKNPAGAVGKYQRSEASPEIKADILEWKNLQEIIERDSTDPDKANTETLRRHSTASDLSMHDVQIEGTHYSVPSPEFKRNFDQTFRGGPDPRDQEIEQLRAQLVDIIDRGNAMLEQHVHAEESAEQPEEKPGARGWTEEKRALASERAKRQHEERRARDAESEETTLSEDPSSPMPTQEIGQLVTEQQASEPSLSDESANATEEIHGQGQ